MKEFKSGKKLRIFGINYKIVRYTEGFVLESTAYENHAVFSKLYLIRYDFMRKVLGKDYPLVENRPFPPVKTLKDLNKVIKALYLEVIKFKLKEIKEIYKIIN